ncbi:PAS domain-containing sensor histidine kinase [Paenibacillus cremeus]|uniref:histidine kinase n=1 Tax=Paenibacillus cremeus TaxID=2163881 RepID=A0A559KFT8_9BACL|nr:PAS domain-containing sensor histidine kinase [Paenibacillus cremeus]TVY10968.1 PAS domain S-box protein [Paenibacillus cremeus]
MENRVDSSRHYRSLYENHPDLVATISLQGNIVDANAACEKVTGYTRSELQQLTPYSLHRIPEKSRSHFQFALNGDTPEYESTIIHKQGHELLLRITYVPIIVDGKVIGVHGMAKDITEYRSIQRALLEKQERFRSLFQHNPNAVVEKDLQGRFTAFNPAFAALTGYDKGELISMTYHDITFPDDLAKSHAAFQRAVKGEAQSFENRICTKEGHILYGSFTYIPIIVDREIVGVYSIVRDITELKQATAQLRYHEDLYELISEHAQDLISYATPDGITQYVSPSIRSLLGYEPDEVIGTSTYHYWHKEDIANAMNIFQHSDHGVFTFRARHKDGRYIWFESTVKAIRNERGEIEKVLGVGRDITERKNTEQLMMNSEKLSLAGQLAAGVAHEIRNPLTAIKGLVQLLERRLTETPPYFSVIGSEINRIEQIVTELLMLAKPQIMQSQYRDVRIIIEQVITLLESQAIMKNVQFIARFEHHEMMIQCDENQLKQVFINFIKNAMESMGSDGVISIDVTRTEPDWIVICIQDEGCGISEEALTKLGQPFYTTKENGTGLGFLISKKIIESQNGKLNITSKVGEGTCIGVLLPGATISTNEPEYAG